jgi:hypothetical protein
MSIAFIGLRARSVAELKEYILSQKLAALTEQSSNPEPTILDPSEEAVERCAYVVEYEYVNGKFICKPGRRGRLANSVQAPPIPTH